jgi:hypothetical protein
MSFEQLHVQALARQQGRCREAGDAGAQHGHVALASGRIGLRAHLRCPATEEQACWQC